MRSSGQEYAASSPQAESFVQPLSRRLAQLDAPMANKVSTIPTWKAGTLSSPSARILRSPKRGFVVVAITTHRDRRGRFLAPSNLAIQESSGSSFPRPRSCRAPGVDETSSRSLGRGRGFESGEDIAQIGNQSTMVLKAALVLMVHAGADVEDTIANDPDRCGVPLQARPWMRRGQSELVC